MDGNIFLEIIFLIKQNETLFIGIVREPIAWLDSFYKEPHHIPIHNKVSPDAFLLNEHYSTIDNYSPCNCNIKVCYYRCF